MKVGIIGAGSWGTALAVLLADAGHEVMCWAYEPEVVDQINRFHENQVYLAGAPLPHSIQATHDLEKALTGAEVVISVSPSHVVRHVMKIAGAYIGDCVPIVSASKGIENDTLMTMSEVLEDVLPLRCHPFLTYLSGPSFAREVAERMPTAVVIACYSEKLARKVQGLLSAPHFRVYTTTDVIGTELGGALKNVIAIASGAAAGMGLGENARAGMITRGLNEMSRLAVRMGANPLTLMGLSGMGDLVLTCTGPLSRNRTVGELLGKGHTLEEILGQMKMVAEGVKNARSVYHLAKRVGVEMPISEQVYRVLYENKPVRQAVFDLMQREVKRETEF